MKDVAVVGVGMTRFGKYPDMGIKDFVREAVNEALLDSGMDKKQIQAAYVGNAAAGAMTGQHDPRPGDVSADGHRGHPGP